MASVHWVTKKNTCTHRWTHTETVKFVFLMTIICEWINYVLSTCAQPLWPLWQIIYPNSVVNVIFPLTSHTTISLLLPLKTSSYTFSKCCELLNASSHGSQSSHLIFSPNQTVWLLPPDITYSKPGRMLSTLTIDSLTLLWFLNASTLQ